MERYSHRPIPFAPNLPLSWLLLRRLRNFAIFLHRWLGLVFCLLFAMWFFSGMVLAYWDFPQVSESDLLAHAQPIDPSHVQVSPEEAYARLGEDNPPEAAVLSMFDG